MKQLNKILIIGRNFHPDGKETAAEIAAALKPFNQKNGFDTEYRHFKDLVFDISNKQIKIIDAPTGKDVKHYKAVLMTNWYSHASIRKDLAYSLALYFQANNVPFVNTEALNSRSTSKLSQMMLAALNNVPVPRTVFSLSLKNAVYYVKTENIQCPVILKDAQASRGKSNFLIDNLKDVEKYTGLHSEKSPLIFQEYIDAEGSDYRIFMMNRQAQLIIKRTATGNSHLNNTSKGSNTELIDRSEFAPAAIMYSEKMSEILHRELTGVDIIFDKNTNQPFFLEANPIPQIATGSNTEAKLRTVADGLAALARGDGIS